MPRIKEAAERYGPEGFAIIAVSMDRTRSDAEEIVRRFSLYWPVYFDGKGSGNALVERFLVSAAPHGVLIDRQGRLRHPRTFPGSPDTNKLIEALLAEAKPERANQP